MTDVALDKPINVPWRGVVIGIIGIIIMAMGTLVTSPFSLTVTQPVSDWQTQDPLTGCAFDGYYPGARGFGACNRGGATTSSNIYYVSNRNAAGAGSFDAALISACANTGVIVFNVSGAIVLQDAINFPSVCNNVTIAGETAPAPGIFFQEVVWSVRQPNNMVISHIYSGPGGDGAWGDLSNRDVMDFSGPWIADNTWIQNITGVWATDETFTCYPQQTGAAVKSNLSWHQIAIVQPLHAAGHPKNPDGHSKAILLRAECHKFDFIRNVILHSADRNPRNSGGVNTFVANNVIYNWGTGVATQGNGASNERQGGIDGWFNFINNIYVKGPDTITGYSDAIMRNKGNVINQVLWEADNVLWTQGGQDRDCDTPTHNCINNETSDANTYAASLIASAYPTGYVPEPMPATDAEQIILAQQILDYAGARPIERATHYSTFDAVWDHPINRMSNLGNEGQVIDCVSDTTTGPAPDCTKNAGGWPIVAQNTIDHSNNNHCDGPIPTATKDNVTSSGRTELHEWLITCQDAMMPVGWRELTLERD